MPVKLNILGIFLAISINHETKTIYNLLQWEWGAPIFPNKSSINRTFLTVAARVVWSYPAEDWWGDTTLQSGELLNTSNRKY